jgi:hypothetical protein
MVAMRFCLIVVIGACCFALCPLTALACDCGSIRVVEAKQHSRAAFVGTALKVSEDGKVEFAVEKVWKGLKADKVTAHVDNGTCSPRLKIGETYLVFAYSEKSKKQLKINLCTRALLADVSQEDLERLGKPTIVRTSKVPNQ